MLNIKELLKIKDVKIIKRKISIYNILNRTNYTMNSLGVFECENHLNYYGIPFDEINLNKLKEYKRNYSIIKRWMVWILNHSEKKEDQKKYPNRFFYFNKYDFILEQDLKNKIFWISGSKIWSKIESKFNYKYLTISNLLNGLLEQHYNCKGFTTLHEMGTYFPALEEHFNCKGFTTGEVKSTK